MKTFLAVTALILSGTVQAPAQQIHVPDIYGGTFGFYIGECYA
jgi:hypothetical protein